VEAYKAADLFLFPSQIECSPLVLFEALASKTPFLTTDVGNAKEIIDWSGGGLLLPTHIDTQGLSRVEVEPAARILEKIWRDVPSRQELARTGFEAWKKKFTWAKISEQYNQLYKELVRS
jgi:glycosyltransferase involved in cell wall biosynthesis